ncbi:MULTISPECIES: NAD(P)/FAD-dependent oxidoreductase [unclassified Streptococcus]|uniref:NAD(P)/FAD-dependent oxidoreductase n=1 Tax=unclassified Streptococcus TaxID=2608887 RepID=UPI001072C91A|nr:MULTISPECIES: NAD(P)/FAD-dependent oxidoreductase [unclassified Streptococcus]MBF0787588.1 NAD(P)/FAD-dependent oxidoreductase [Streptococcus sp. 19428wC2_LYSM12]MCQ9211975.1 NAD(P)/FAD-dependent oxidoreductase [Streptococcus sp. B01]MCQ9213304.1 NAD(P)/FAD-dependent oxidoreductase [Streptococcus sp. O1]TFV05431.1 NAD(P)/FAD-dependent oxidoreductase [Streptococcus sp. LYSM12]
MAKNIVIVGAGYAGISAARLLGKKFKKNDDVTVTLIDKNSFHTYMTELHEVAAGRVEKDAIKYDLKRIFNKYPKVNLVTDKVVEIDYDKKEVIAEHQTLPFDYLLLAMGGEANDFGIKGVKENGFTLWSIEAAERLHDHIVDSCYRAMREHDEEKRRALLTFTVIGAGFTGIEMIGELIDWVPILAHEFKLNPAEFSLKVIEAMPNILQMVTEKEQVKTRKYLEKKGVELVLGDGVAAVEADKLVLSSGREISTHTSIWTAGVQANSDASEFGIEKARAGRLVANEYMEAKGKENVYVAGDLVYYEEPGNDGKPTPQIVQAAEQTGHTAAQNIIAAITGGEKHSYKGKYDGFMVSIGSRYGVAFLMGKYHLSGFMAMFMKHMVNLLYFFTIRSFFYMGSYVRHEFFDIKNKRNIFGGHTSGKGNLLWSAPLRVFYGSVWLYEGVKKAFGLFGTTSWLGDQVVFPFPWLADPVSGASAAEATSSASQAATETAQAIFGLSYAYGEQPMTVLDGMPDWFASIMQFMMPNQEVALFMQKFMTIAEIGIGLALIAGAFVWIVSAATVALVVMFSLSGMFYWVNIWFIPVAISLMNGAGRSFGLDYWIMPWLGRFLDRKIYGKPKHIYTLKDKR